MTETLIVTKNELSELNKYISYDLKVPSIENVCVEFATFPIIVLAIFSLRETLFFTKKFTVA